MNWKTVRKVLKVVKKYKDNPKSNPNVKSDLEYNIFMYLQKEIPLNDVGAY